MKFTNSVKVCVIARETIDDQERTAKTSLQS
jgi:hypothetical protein